MLSNKRLFVNSLVKKIRKTTKGKVLITLLLTKSNLRLVSVSSCEEIRFVDLDDGDGGGLEVKEVIENRNKPKPKINIRDSYLNYIG
jgi:hypothetical protein